jgi:hypothetical protein
MRTAGIDLSASASSELALRLHRAGYAGLAHRIGIAVDTDQDQLSLSPRDRTAILSVLNGCPINLKKLRDQLL